MKIDPRFYPAIIIGAFLVFLIIGFLLGFLPERGGEGHQGAFLLLPTISAVLGRFA